MEKDLRNAVRAGDTNRVKALLDQGADIDAMDDAGTIW